MLDSSYLDLLRCPHCAPRGKGQLHINNNWLRCTECAARYPIVDDIPVMLPEEGERYRDVAAEDLPTLDSHNRHS